MMSASVEPGQWPRRRWWLAVALVFGGQIGVIFWLADRTPAHPRPPANAPAFHLAGRSSSELLALQDPTLFALPHRQSFSGAAWMNTSPMRIPSLDWSEPTNWLSLPVRELGAVFERFVETNQFDSWQMKASPEADLTLPALFPLTGSAEKSKLRIVGGLADRRLLTPLDLPSWAARTNSAGEADILTNTVVHLVISGNGECISAVVLSGGSGLKAADDYGLEQAKTARFESLLTEGPSRVSSALAHLSWGEMIFEWHTLPP